MLAALAADVVVFVHFAFIVFVMAGGLLLLRWPRVALLHLPAIAWAALIEFMGWICPLTPLENALRHAAGEAGYSGGFVAEYLFPLIYPAGLTRDDQIELGLVVIAGNALVYGYVWWRWHRQGISDL